MVTMNIVEAKAKLSALVARAQAGEEVFIARNGRFRVRLEPMQLVRKSTSTPAK